MSDLIKYLLENPVKHEDAEIPQDYLKELNAAEDDTQENESEQAEPEGGMFRQGVRNLRGRVRDGMQNLGDKAIAEAQEENIEDIYEIDGTIDPELSATKKFIEATLGALEAKGVIPDIADDATLLEKYNNFLGFYAPEANTLNSMDEFRNGHLAALYAAGALNHFYKDDGSVYEEQSAMLEELNSTAEGRALNFVRHAAERYIPGVGQPDMPNMPDSIPRMPSVPGGIPTIPDADMHGLYEQIKQAQTKDEVKDAMQPYEGAKASGLKTSDVIENIGDEVVQAAVGPDLKVFLKEALSGLLGGEVSIDSDVLVGALNKFLYSRGEEEPLASYKDISAQQLSVVFEQAAVAGLLNPDNENNIILEWDNLREELGLPEGMEMASAPDAPSVPDKIEIAFQDRFDPPAGPGIG